ncbi:RIP metalloprotease RseP [Helicobacter sp.]|uniref:RIP metalloprotease RseP n=1 Tax=Helicobacter sp. TaxID=218 RepID=UPI0025BB506C|nr:RIP metalloprotease RseP [Helicobacter sp.]MBR2495204.1 RIP metalloprotease RseP [Helicobacter sp.]
MGIFSAFLALCFLVFFHELGHFCAARLFGVRVEVFSIGFGRKLLCKRIGNTEYALSLIPLGGYVKLKGQDDLNPTSHEIAKDSYNTRHPLVKITILSAGVVFNILLAFLLYIAIGVSGVNILQPVVGSVQEQSPSQKAGILPDDRIIKIDSTFITSWEQLSQIIAQAKPSDSSFTPTYTPHTLHIQRGDELKSLTITPESSNYQNIFGDTIQRPMIGIVAKGEVGVEHLGLVASIKFAIQEVVRASLLIFESLKRLILGLIPLGELSGVIGIVDVMAEVAPSGFYAFAMVMALISVNLAVINLLPIPALDGGQIVFVCYEALMKKRMSDKALYALTMFGWTVLLGLLALGVYNDVLRIVTRTMQ